MNLNESQSIRETFGDEDIEGNGDDRMNLIQKSPEEKSEEEETDVSKAYREHCSFENFIKISKGMSSLKEENN